MATHRRNRRQAHRREMGTPPGTLTADPLAARTVISVFGYGPEGCEENARADLAAVKACLAKWPVTWVNVEGLADVTAIQALGDLFKLHGLALEDVLSQHQHPKVEPYRDHLFLVVRMIDAPPSVQMEQLSIFLGKSFVLTFQDGQPGDCLEPVRKRIREGTARIRQYGPDYLAYSLVDAVVDAYFPHLDEFSDRIERLETEVVEHPQPATVSKLHELRRDLLAVRRTVSPLREAVNSLVRDTGDLLTDSTRLYMRDCYDHAIRIIDLAETYREIASGLLDVYLSSVGNRLNEIMKVLTIITVIFIPLSFLAGVYGMNFHTDASQWNMPELTWKLGYAGFWAVCLLATGFQLYMFYRKGWLTRGERPKKDHDQERMP